MTYISFHSSFFIVGREELLLLFSWLLPLQHSPLCIAVVFVEVGRQSDPVSLLLVAAVLGKQLKRGWVSRVPECVVGRHPLQEFEVLLFHEGSLLLVAFLLLFCLQQFVHQLLI